MQHTLKFKKNSEIMIMSIHILQLFSELIKDFKWLEIYIYVLLSLHQQISTSLP